jgi:putative ABC transport system permease protein
MILYKALLIINEGLIFGIFALGIYVAFQWLKFPDLTPDGSFVLGACVYVKAVTFGMPLFLALFASILAGILAGMTTASLNKIIKIPTVVSGLLVSTGLYSLSWLLLGKPNQFLQPKFTFIGDITGINASFHLFLWFVVFVILILFLLKIFGDSIWGLKLRAIGENHLLAKDLGTKEFYYTYIGLGVANGLVALAGALFSQRSYSADINMGIGQTIIGLIGMILGLLICRNKRQMVFILPCIVLGAIFHKLIIFFTLEIGMPAESFRLLSALFFVILFFLIKVSGKDFLKGLKWS